MKTTIDIADSLFKEVKQMASRQGITFRAVVETALRHVIEAEKLRARRPFRLRKHSFRGRGLQAGLSEDDWEAIRNRAYEGRGG
jgi:hypothetical protein